VLFTLFPPIRRFQGAAENASEKFVVNLLDFIVFPSVETTKLHVSTIFGQKRRAKQREKIKKAHCLKEEIVLMPSTI
jgi:hypothetical protein